MRRLVCSLGFIILCALCSCTTTSPTPTLIFMLDVSSGVINASTFKSSDLKDLVHSIANQGNDQAQFMLYVFEGTLEGRPSSEKILTKEELFQAIDHLSATQIQGKTCIYDALADLARRISQQTDLDQQRAIVLATDGEDTKRDKSRCSITSAQAALEQISATHTPVYTIRLVTGYSPLPGDPAVSEIAAKTGGTHLADITPKQKVDTAQLAHAWSFIPEPLQTSPTPLLILLGSLLSLGILYFLWVWRMRPSIPLPPVQSTPSFTSAPVRGQPNGIAPQYSPQTIDISRDAAAILTFQKYPGKPRGTGISVFSFPFKIGRSGGKIIVDLSLDDDLYISHYQAELFLRDHIIMVRDHSRNGITVNRQQMRSGEELPLKSGDYLCLSDQTILVFNEFNAPALIDTHSGQIGNPLTLRES